jgi:hypothetical protein
LTEITDEYIKQIMLKTKEYCIVILKGGPNKTMAGVEKIIWDHEQRNFSLRADGLLSIVCLVRDGIEIHDVGIFNAGRDEVRSIMEEDPNMKAGVFVYDLHICRSFPEDCLR